MSLFRSRTANDKYLRILSMLTSKNLVNTVRNVEGGRVGFRVHQLELEPSSLLEPLDCFLLFRLIASCFDDGCSNERLPDDKVRLSVDLVPVGAAEPPSTYQTKDGMTVDHIDFESRHACIGTWVISWRARVWGIVIMSRVVGGPGAICSSISIDVVVYGPKTRLRAIKRSKKLTLSATQPTYKLERCEHSFSTVLPHSRHVMWPALFTGVKRWTGQDAELESTD